MLHDLMEATPYLALIGLGAGLLLLGRDRSDADEHDLSDYHEPVPLNDDDACDICHGDPAECGHLQDDDEWPDDDILPPAPAGMNAGSPLYAGMLFDTWHPEDADAVAARWLRELGEQARTAVAR